LGFFYNASFGKFGLEFPLFSALEKKTIFQRCFACNHGWI
jgi:hypothetical protein